MTSSLQDRLLFEHPTETVEVPWFLVADLHTALNEHSRCRSADAVAAWETLQKAREAIIYAAILSYNQKTPTARTT